MVLPLVEYTVANNKQEWITGSKQRVSTTLSNILILNINVILTYHMKNKNILTVLGFYTQLQDETGTEGVAVRRKPEGCKTLVIGNRFSSEKTRTERHEDKEDQNEGFAKLKGKMNLNVNAVSQDFPMFFQVAMQSHNSSAFVKLNHPTGALSFSDWVSHETYLDQDPRQ